MGRRLTFLVITIDGDIINFFISHQVKNFKSVLYIDMAKFVKIFFCLLKNLGLQESFVYRVLLLLEINGIFRSSFQGIN